MTISFPFSVAEFWEAFQLLDGASEFDLMPYRQQSQDGAGNIIGAKFGEPKWTADVLIAPKYNLDAGLIKSRIKILQGRGDSSFLAYDRMHPYPKMDPTGSVISGATVQVRTKGSNNRSMSLKGLPVGYVLSEGDRISVTNGSGLRALMELGEAATADGSGNTVEFEVQPFLPTWIAVNQAVSLSKPVAKFKILTGTYKRGTAEGKRTVGMGFSMISVA